MIEDLYELVDDSEKKKINKVRLLMIVFAVSISVFVGLFITLSFVMQTGGLIQPNPAEETGIGEESANGGFVVQEDFLTKNRYSRPAKPLKKVNNIVVHYVGNPGTSAQNNRDYFESLGRTRERFASSHFIVGLEGEIIQCIPLNEIAYCSNHRNNDTIGIEVCHEDEVGAFNRMTYDSLVKLCAWLIHKYNLEPKDIIRHYDVSGKLCPIYYVENQDEWDQFIFDVSEILNK